MATCTVRSVLNDLFFGCGDNILLKSKIKKKISKKKSKKKKFGILCNKLTKRKNKYRMIVVDEEERQRRARRAARFQKEKAMDPKGTGKFAAPKKTFAHQEKLTVKNKNKAVLAFENRKKEIEKNKKRIRKLEKKIRQINQLLEKKKTEELK